MEWFALRPISLGFKLFISLLLKLYGVEIACIYTVATCREKPRFAWSLAHLYFFFTDQDAFLFIWIVRGNSTAIFIYMPSVSFTLLLSIWLFISYLWIWFHLNSGYVEAGVLEMIIWKTRSSRLKYYWEYNGTSSVALEVRELLYVELPRLHRNMWIPMCAVCRCGCVCLYR